MQYSYKDTFITISPHTPQHLVTTSRYADLATKIRPKIAGSNPAIPTNISSEVSYIVLKYIPRVIISRSRIAKELRGLERRRGIIST